MNPWIFFAIAIKLLSAAFDPEGPVQPCFSDGLRLPLTPPSGCQGLIFPVIALDIFRGFF
jgi:hypothetical protein